MTVYDTIHMDLPAPGFRFELFRDLHGKGPVETNMQIPRRLVTHSLSVTALIIDADAPLPEGRILLRADDRILTDLPLSTFSVGRTRIPLTFGEEGQSNLLEGLVRSDDDLRGQVTVGAGGSGRLTLKVTLEGE